MQDILDTVKPRNCQWFACVLFAWGKHIPVLQSEPDLAKVWQDRYPGKHLIYSLNRAGAHLVKGPHAWNITHPNESKAVCSLECQQNSSMVPHCCGSHYQEQPSLQAPLWQKKKFQLKSSDLSLAFRVKRSRWEKMCGSVHITIKKCFFACSRRITKSQVPRPELW